MLNSLSHNFGDHQGVGLIPDWCSVNNNDEFSSFEGKSSNFGYESMRVPFRVGLDFVWFQNEQAEKFVADFSGFLEHQFEAESVVFCEYDYTGQVLKRYESPAFYACYYYSLQASGSKYSKAALKKCRNTVRRTDNGWVYQNEQEYYVNSLAWLADGLQAGVIRDLSH